MKKNIYIAMAVAFSCLMVSCSAKKANSPGAAAKKYTEYVVDGQYDKFVDGIYFGEKATPEEVAQGREMMTGLLTEKAKPTFDEKGGMKSVEVVSETIAEDGNSADVVLKQNFGDGTSEDESYKMELVDGKWMMKVEK